MFLPPPPRRDRDPERARLRGWANLHPWRFAVVFAVLGVSVASVLPIWTAWSFSGWEGLGERASLWDMLAAMLRAAEQVGWRPMLLRYNGPQLIQLVVLVVLAPCIGRWIAGRAGKWS